MQIKKSEKFLLELEEIISFIAKDNPNRAENFYNQMLENLENLGFMPYKFRKSNLFDDENIRDYIFKEYVMPYKIDEDKNIIIILGIYKDNIWEDK